MKEGKYGSRMWRKILLRIGFGNVDQPAAGRLIDLFADETDHRYVSDFTSPARAKSSLLGRVLLRCLLSEVTDTNPSNWILPSNTDIGPKIAISTATDNAIYVSVSHSDQLVVVALCQEVQIGLDAENLNKKRNFDRILSHLVGDLKMPGQITLPEFYRLWTLHEAFCKSKGQGLEFPISTPVRLAFTNARSGDLYATCLEGQRYQFLTGDLSNSAVAICLLTKTTKTMCRDGGQITTALNFT